LVIDRKSELAHNLAEVKKTIPDSVHLIVVTKTFPLSDAQLLHELGVKEFGENGIKREERKHHLWRVNGIFKDNFRAIN
jgi:uncharacterized pyridoxal phosphate-containing UPF0001 family protein